MLCIMKSVCEMFIAPLFGAEFGPQLLNLTAVLSVLARSLELQSQQLGCQFVGFALCLQRRGPQ
jgi:hypothetical protein